MAGPRLLIFGGTFDPPHRAHVELPPIVARRVGCTQVIYVPAAINPLKTEQPTPAAHRVAMLRVALRDVPNVEIDTCEIDREGPSYTVDTLAELRDRHGDGVEMRLLIGSDQAANFRRWRDWPRILELATPAVMIRPGHPVDRLREALSADWAPDEVERWLGWTVEVPQIDVCATELRAALARGGLTGELERILPPGVAEYIRENGLYAGNRTVSGS